MIYKGYTIIIFINYAMHVVFRCVVHHLTDVERFGDALRLVESVPLGEDYRQYVVASRKAVIDACQCSRQIQRALKHERVFVAVDAKTIDDFEVAFSWEAFSMDKLVDQMTKHDQAVLQWTRTSDVQTHDVIAGSKDYELTSTCTMEFFFLKTGTSSVRVSIESQELDYDYKSNKYSVGTYVRPVVTSSCLRMHDGTVHVQKLKTYMEELHALLMQ